MTRIIILAALMLLMTELFARTRRPKRSALLSAAAGVAALFLFPLAAGREVCADPFTVGVSAAMGVPGAAMCLFIPLLSGGGVL